MKRNERMRIVLLGLYLVSLILFGLLKFDGTFDIVIRTHKSMISNDGVNINMIPFRTIRTYWDIKSSYVPAIRFFSRKNL